MRGKLVLLLLSLLGCASLAHGDILGDGVDDLMTGPNASGLITASAGTIFATVKHTGTLLGTSTCVRQIILGTASTVVQLGSEASPDEWAGKIFDGATKCAGGTFSTAWTTLVWRYDGTNIELYIDGALVEQTAAGNATSVSSLMLMLWDGSTTNAQFPGVVAQVAFYNTALSAELITAHSQSYVMGVLPNGPTAVVDFSHCTHGVSTDTYVFWDRTGNARHIAAADGANNTGMSCVGSTKMVTMGGIQ